MQRWPTGGGLVRLDRNHHGACRFPLCWWGLLSGHQISRGLPFQAPQDHHDQQESWICWFFERHFFHGLKMLKVVKIKTIGKRGILNLNLE